MKCLNEILINHKGHGKGSQKKFLLYHWELFLLILLKDKPSPKSLTPGTSATYIKTENLSYFSAIMPHKSLKIDYIQINQLPVTMGWY